MYKVAVIDDSPFVFKAVKRALEPAGFQVSWHAENGQQGLELIEQVQPDIITLDMTMPIMDGFEVMARLDATDLGKVIMLSAMNDEFLQDQARAKGVRQILAKPFKADELLSCAYHVLRETGRCHD